MEIIIDRFEGEFAVCETDNRKTFNLPKALFENAKEGDIYIIEKDEEKTSSSRERIEGKLKDLFD